MDVYFPNFFSQRLGYSDLTTGIDLANHGSRSIYLLFYQEHPMAPTTLLRRLPIF